MKDLRQKHILMLLLLVSGTSWATLLDPEHPATPTASTVWSLRSANGQAPQQDYTVILLSQGHDVLTGGPLSFAPPLAGIMDITGPDWSDIAAYLDTEEGFRMLPVQVARFVNHSRPPLPSGVLYTEGKPDTVDLFPQHLWWIPHQLQANRQDAHYYQAAVPEVSTLTLFALGGLLLSHRRRTKR